MYYQLSKIIRIGIILFFTSILYINRKMFNKDIMFRLFIFYLLLGSFANFLSQMPSGGRYLVIADFILYGVMFYFVQEYKKIKFYNGWLLQSIMEYKESIFDYIQNYYRSFIRQKEIEYFPWFEYNNDKI